MDHGTLRGIHDDAPIHSPGPSKDGTGYVAPPRGFFAPPRESKHSSPASSSWDLDVSSDESSDNDSQPPPDETTEILRDNVEVSAAQFLEHYPQLQGDQETLLMMTRIPEVGHEVGNAALQAYLIRDTPGAQKQVTLHGHRLVFQMSFIYQIVYVICVLATIQEMEAMKGLLATWDLDDRMIIHWETHFKRLSSQDKKFGKIFKEFMTSETKKDMYNFLNEYGFQIFNKVLTFRSDFLCHYLSSDWDVHRIVYSMVREALVLAAQRDEWDRYRRATVHHAFTTSLFNPDIIRMGIHLPGRMKMRELILPLTLLPSALQLVPSTILPTAEHRMDNLSYLNLIPSPTVYPSKDTKLRKWRWREQDVAWGYATTVPAGWTIPPVATDQYTVYNLLVSVTQSMIVALHWTRFSFPRSDLPWQDILRDIHMGVTRFYAENGKLSSDGPWNSIL